MLRLNSRWKRTSLIGKVAFTALVGVAAILGLTHQPFLLLFAAYMATAAFSLANQP